jgi:hypothetical protein
LEISELVPYAQVAGTFAAAAGLFVNAWQFWRNRKATTLQHLQELFRTMNEREAALSEAKGDEPKYIHAFVEFLNFLEIYSAALNTNLFIGAAREIARDKVLDSIVALDSMPHWHGEIENSITSGVTYKHISLLMRRERRVIAARKHAATEAGTYIQSIPS